MAKIRVTVVKRTFNQELADEYCGPGASICDSFSDGQEYVIDGLSQPAGFCAWAWNDIHKAVLALNSGGSFSPWMKADNTLIACCSDGIRPVIFRIERLEA